MNATPNPTRTNARRVASIAGTVVVTATAAVASYDHTRALALHAGQSPTLAALLPLSVDGLMLVATVAIGDGRRHTGSAWLAFLVGLAASLAANVMAADPNTTARVVSAWPAVALLATVEILARAGRGQTVANVDTQAPEPLPAKGTHAPSAATVEPRKPRPATVRLRPATTAARVAAALAEAPHLSTDELAAALGISPRSARRYRAATVTA